MKKFSLILLGCLCLLLIGFGGYKASVAPQKAHVASIESSADEVVSENNSTDEDFDWAVWFKEEALPVVIATGIGIVTICSVLAPVLNTVNGGIKLFKKSKDEYDKTTGQVLDAQSEINKTVKSVESLLTEVHTLTIQVDNLTRITKMAISNNAELVKNGYANEILKIGGENGSEEVKETNTNTDAM